MMLKNQRNNSCEQNCWTAEDHGAISPRLSQKGDIRTHDQVFTSPETLDIATGSDCNLTCSYCCKEFSSAWRNDLANNGSYNITQADDRFQLTSMDRVLMKISQPELKKSKHYQTLLNEVRLMAPGLKNVIITGGEPFLDNQLVDTITQLSTNAVIKIYTGLGVSGSRFKKIIDKIQNLPNVILIISAESTNKFFEFNRYGNLWDDFVLKIKYIKEKNINFQFHGTITNLTMFDFKNFVEYFSENFVFFAPAYQPHFMAPYVLDEHSKNIIRSDCKKLPEFLRSQILKSIQATPTEQQKNNCKEFLIEFTNRRPDLSLTIFPPTFLQWLGLSHVV
jgi:organic radical activating enzyme